ncbi:hypothetical protein AVO45_18110 [Ruegeria marisrubri]|uniref:Glycosyl transferase family 1 n=2 Tax=Ruegeria marisrubri TaxID=1685379 RepID=A0A0X3UBN4_9RHOB|nr:hypothetical protein AVO45_18110 [Ruegeria marisrubri]
MTGKPIHVLHVAPSFWPATAFGGPIHSTKAITDGIAANPDFFVEVITTDAADPNTTARLKLPENPLRMPAGYQVRYCRKLVGNSVSVELLWRLVGAVRRADVVHLTGPYNFPVIPALIACRLTGTPIVWSPRGGFQATAQWAAVPKRRLKEFFEKFCAKLGPDRMVLHVTAPVEAETSARNFPRARVELIPNAIEMPKDLPKRVWRSNGRLRLAFLSRIHPKKGLDLLISALASLPEHVTLDVYGDGDPAYLSILNEQISKTELTGRVAFHGHVEDEGKTAALTGCDLFVLPTHSENFGIVVAEALAHGTPVVVTKNAPWEMVENEGCGRWVEASSEALADAISELAAADLGQLGERGRAWVTRNFTVDGMVRKFARLYQDLALKADPKGTLKAMKTL